MTENIHELNKQLLQPLRAALYDFDEGAVRSAIAETFAPDALVQLCHPFETLSGPDALFESVLKPLASAIPDLERRDTIVMAGGTPEGHNWVGCCGYYTGSFEKSWLDIPATGHQVSMRFHEFYRIEQGRVVEMQALWDIPEVMMQAGAWPMVPSLGREWHVPGPATQDGLSIDSGDRARAARSQKLVHDMCDALGNYATGGVEGMQLDKYWHPRCSWYGPSGIGTGRGIQGFRNWHQIPFLNGLPDRVGDAGAGHIFADGDYVGFTAWPGMYMSVSGDGWLGIAPAGQKITMRSLDFWRCENGMIRENWVLVDLLHVYAQLGVDVFARMREFNKARR
ncbi:ester cyclase [Biformimicrobium ophioploci]|uniref:Nuclear transport factor 2 family protein n=1 Tax=Biformimicrobium ophioploci TaxID=3036711 RepID=A0ABQ6M0S4_9GAMM|nr:ester cyclase [Microbulbifer sp. NKW57]GMG87932.1 nuclear transport factor 2 family protein [Microbulbifer sp. NKW57]